MEFYCIPGKGNTLYKHYLNKRHQTVSINISTITLYSLNGLKLYSVPQGSILGPLLLLLHTHTIIISNLSNDRSKASSKMIPPHSAI